ncbi:Modulator of transcription 2 [Hyphodiscus hymeniophilus]|uniref:Modulator of transcription 2 n=1 Tax=Hyphodiscus hymeniophilus TaxID=353542 RepID=A0A9P6SLV7_9HELO|nr:Modulator of transcription 2 [Hyphodiscus hymeniophilus]
MAPQDSFIDEDEETCPLCVEEFDLTDRNFRPCPCGYQVCQFCFNNIRTNLNGLCPACRRPYDDKTIEYKVVTPEELAQFKANVQKNAKKKAEQRQKEAQKREVESLNRKHLSGLRVIQKNLVYVVGLSPGIKEDEILNTLRGDKYFGQYGKIIKIVVSKGGKNGEVSANGQPSLGVYVTFAKKEDAARCIAAVNGSTNGDRVLRAQLGTTKYCSAYLRGENCTNKSCMFLHEPGENENSYSREDLSNINTVNTQRLASSSGSSRQAAQVQAPLQQAQPVAAATQPMARETSKEGSDSGDGSALPSSASWARGGTQQRSRRGSHATSGAASSPAVSQAMPITAQVNEEQPESIPDEQLSEPVAPTLGVSRPARDPVLLELLKSINSPTITFPAIPISTSDELASYPPLFDDQGGEKRRAMREQQEEARLHLEQESQADVRSVTEPVEEEEPESGSLQLGGEPEDRDSGREPPQGFQRRPSTQLPIQRGSSGGSYGTGPGQNFPQNLGNLSSINGRTLTPLQQQQLLLLKSSQPQPGFADQFPPGMAGGLGQGSTLFQQQGHNRQSSRYSFANDSSSTSTVKPSANPKFLAQQTSMMPTPSHAQQGSQFYGPAMPGPPPGLKSSGTPPMGFGQNHSFGGSMGGGSLFGGIGKESSNDMLRDMLRGRGSAGGIHDAGKRELMFPSFLSQQYPSASSTPAPASGLLASLYGPQTGAFHDFGQKQKKKGKKHRHANTSSSGGGGLVDLADPSILQARMQHQQQSNAGVGHGLFGGQAQEDLDLLPLDEASLDVDALVADSTTDDMSYRSFAAFDRISRSSTPSIPPGFGLPLPSAHPIQIQNEPIAAPKTGSKIIPTSAPFTPSRNIIPRASTPLTNISVPTTPTQSIAKPRLPAAFSLQAQAKEDVKTLATNSGLSKAIASQSSAAPALQPEDFPALDSGKTKTVGAQLATKLATPGKNAPVTAANKKQVTASSTSTTTAPSASKTLEKSKTAGILNISVASKPASKPTGGVSDSQAKPSVGPSAFPPLPTSTPAVIQPPLTRTAPKMLRLVPTPKTEVPPTGSATPSSTTSMFPQTFAPSRQTSIASNTRLDRPATPTSEIISDNASITSASMSRASSPPPTKVGSAPVRATTKSMQKKQRREIQKEKEKEKLEQEVTTTKPEPEPEIAPIMGRKKKQRKERAVHSAAGGSTPAASRPASPGFAAPTSEDSKTSQEIVEQSAQANTPPAPVEREILKPVSRILDSNKAKGKIRATRPPTPEPVPTVMGQEEEESTEKALPTPAAILQELISEGTLKDINSLNFLKPPTVNFRTQDAPMDMLNANPKLAVTPEERAELLAGKSVHKIVDGGSRIMLTPNGDCVRNLTTEEERRYLELQALISKQAGPAAFSSVKHHANSGFTLIGGRAVPNGPPPFFPKLSTSATTMDPVSKIQRDEALSYINQFVLPSLSTNSQLEKALNANALDAEMLRSSEVPTWATWGSGFAAGHPEDAEGAYGTHHEGILATGLEHMTAHFAIGKDIDRGQPMGNVSLLSLTEAESAMQMARKETDNLEKRLNTILKKNRRILLGSGH